MIDLPIYRVRARNTAAESENKIHDDRVASQYGFRGGLVPGVTVYGYMTVPLVEFAPEWLERGSMRVRFLEPFYDGDEVIVRTRVNDDLSIGITADRDDGTTCGTATAAIRTAPTQPPERYPEAPLPEHRPIPTPENLIPGTILGSVVERLDLAETQQLLHFSNAILMTNFQLGPWIHAASEIKNWKAAKPGDDISARGRIHDRFERKGHEFVIVDVMLIANQDRLLQTVRHTAIYRPRKS